VLHPHHLAAVRPFIRARDIHIDIMAENRRTVGGVALILMGAALQALISAVQVRMGWQRLDRVVKQGVEQGAALSGLE
jgi:DMSO/TMAO reductase YedYZ heme-binding membrane subunit